MGMPKKLFDMNMFVNGTSMIGKAEEVTPPKLSMKLEEYRGAGMPGSASVFMGLDSGALDLEFTLGGLETTVLSQMYTSISAVQLRFAGSFLDDATGNTVGCEIQVRGRLTELDWGSAKPGENTQHKYTMKNTYCRVTIADEVFFEADILNSKLQAYGRDIMEAHRKNLGL